MLRADILHVSVVRGVRVIGGDSHPGARVDNLGLELCSSHGGEDEGAALNGAAGVRDGDGLVRFHRRRASRRGTAWRGLVRGLVLLGASVGMRRVGCRGASGREGIAGVRLWGEEALIKIDGPCLCLRLLCLAVWGRSWHRTGVGFWGRSGGGRLGERWWGRRTVGRLGF